MFAPFDRSIILVRLIHMTTFARSAGALLAGLVLLTAGCDRRDGSAARAASPQPEATPVTLEDNATPVIEDRQAFAPVHIQLTTRFTDAIGLGVSRMSRPELKTPWLATDTSGQKWNVESVQLVSLLEHDPAEIYVIPEFLNKAGWEQPPYQLPEHYEYEFKPMKYEEPREPVMRPLDDFEKAALAMLRKDAGALPAVSGKNGRIRYVGAVRATQWCIRCHQHESSEPGDLIGAFTCILTPADDGTPRKNITMR
jgi:hypothetical protein